MATKTELQAQAASLEIAFTKKATMAELQEMINAKLGTAPETVSLGFTPDGVEQISTTHGIENSEMPPEGEGEDDENLVNDLLAGAETSEVVDLAESIKEVKRRKVSAKERDDSGKVVRKGRNLSGNQPFRVKPYYYDLDVTKTENYDKAFQAAPMQVRLILKYMETNGITTEDDACIGAEIAGGAINSGALQSKIDPAALFAYYRRVMERLGLRLADGE